jgi:hypothetical protein
VLSQDGRWNFDLEFQSKMNTIGGDVLVAINKAMICPKRISRFGYEIKQQISLLVPISE